jgi:hypothetical protein
MFSRMQLVLPCVFFAAVSIRAHAEPPPGVISAVDEQTNTSYFWDEDEAARDARTPQPAEVQDRNQVHLALGVGGPTGLVGLRYSRVVTEVGTRIEPGIGLGYTGVVG